MIGFCMKYNTGVILVEVVSPVSLTPPNQSCFMT